MHVVPPILGIFVFIFISWLISENRRAIRWKPIGIGLGILLLLAFFFLKTAPGIRFQEFGSSGISMLIEAANSGASAVFNTEMVSGKLLCVALTIASSIIFIGALTAILYHLGILQRIIWVMAWCVSRSMGISGAEAFIATANIFLGMVEAPFAVRPYLAKFTRSEIFCMMTCGMATIAGGVMVLYATLIKSVGMQPGHLIIASILSVFSSVLFAKIMIPETEKSAFELSREEEKNGILNLESPDVNILDAACRGASEGMKLSLNVIACMIALTALITFLNLCFGLFGEVAGGPLTLQRIFAWVFSPFAWLLGVPCSECGFAGQLLGEKTVLNEFIAYLDLSNPENLGLLSERSRVILTYALCGFANFGSLAIMVGGIGSLVPEKRRDIAQLALRSLLSGTFAAFITACLSSIFI